MPNWVQCHLNIKGPAQEVESFVAKQRGTVKQYKPSAIELAMLHTAEQAPVMDLTLSSEVPIPQEVLDCEYDPTGYNWQKLNWGCKWDANDSVLVYKLNGEAEYVFATPWAPPTEWLSRAAMMNPCLQFELNWIEEDCYSGKCVAKDGFIVINTETNDRTKGRKSVKRIVKRRYDKAIKNPSTYVHPNYLDAAV